MEVLGKIDPSLYWEWRTTIEEQKVAKLKQEVSHMKLHAMERELEIMKLRANIFRNSEVAHAKELVQAADKEYEAMKLRIEQSSGVELKDCIIDDITYEIKRLDPGA